MLKYLEITKDDGTIIKGLELPYENKNILVLKLDSGYNIGISKDKIKSIKMLKEIAKKNVNYDSEKQTQNKKLPKIAFINMGGTIASKVDYETGAVNSLFSSEDLLKIIPELKNLAQIDSFNIINKLSENISLDDWHEIALFLKNLDFTKYKGIVITHGTDTLAYTSSALSFLVEKTPLPIVFVGAQKSSDRPSSDATYNVLGAVNFILNTKKTGVFVAMHKTIEDKTVSIHLGTRIRKMHTSRRDAFKSINETPVADVSFQLKNENIEDLKIKYYPIYAQLPEDKEKIIFTNKLNGKVFLLKYFPGLNVEIFEEILKKHDVIILEGTGFGHIHNKCIEILKKYTKQKKIFMTTQAINGMVNLNIYSTGRKLQKIGVIGLKNMLCEVAYIKALYLLSKNKDLNKNMLKPLFFEISDRNIYLDQ